MNKTKSGFTIIELLIAIAIIGILATITVVGLNSILADSKNEQRASRVKIIAEALEKYYNKNGEYPDCTAMTQSASAVVENTLIGMDPEALATPNAPSGTNSIICDDINGFGDDVFAYVIGSTRWTLKYREQNTSNIISLTSRYMIPCPSGFIVVPGSSIYGTSDFCVMKYEAKNGGNNIPVSQPNGLPWVSISQTNAIAYSPNVAGCNGCHLITEAEWLTIAQNVLNVPSNWDNGAGVNEVGTGYIYSGHSDNSPSGAQEADSNDSNGYANTDNVSPSRQRRTLLLSNGNVIWDFVGNVNEWTTGTINGGQQPGLSGEVTYTTKQWNDTSLLQNGLPNNAMPYYTGIAGASSWSITQGIGVLFSNYGETTQRGFYRGGQWNSHAGSGVYMLGLEITPGSNRTYIGFRVAR